MIELTTNPILDPPIRLLLQRMVRRRQVTRLLLLRTANPTKSSARYELYAPFQSTMI